MKTKTMANEIKKVMDEMKLKSGISYTTDTITVDLYKDDYDYSQVNLKLIENITAEEYVATVLHAIKEKNENVREYEAPTVERFIVDLIKKYKAEDFIHVIEGNLHGDFENDYISIDDIVIFKFSPYGDVLELQEDQAGDQYYYTIDLKNKTLETRVELLEDMEFDEEEVK